MAEGVGLLRTGNLLMVTCCALYLAWWSLAFNPLWSCPVWAKVVGFVCTLAAGAAGVTQLVGGIGEVGADRVTAAIVVAGVVAYAVLLALTSRLLHRQVTTELALICAWAAMELCVVRALWVAGALGPVATVVLAVATVAAAAIGLVCYLAYYELDPVPAFVDGMVPLALCGAVSALAAALVALA